MTEHIFISYSKKDGAFAHKLADDLIDAGFKIWIDRSIGGGDLWRETIKRNLKMAGDVIIIVSHNSMASEWVKHEGSLAYGWGKKLYPIVIERVPSLPPWLEEYQWIDFVETSHQAAFNALVAALTPPNPVQDLLTQQVLVYKQTGELIGEAILRVIEENPKTLVIDNDAQELIHKSKQVIAERQEREQQLVAEREAARQRELENAKTLAQTKEQSLKQLRIRFIISIILLMVAAFFAWSYLRQTQLANAKTVELRSIFLAENTNKLLREGNSSLAILLAMAATEGDSPSEKAHNALQNAAYSSMASNVYSLCRGWISDVSLNPVDENVAAAGCSTKDRSIIYLINLETGTVFREIEYPSRILSLTFSVDGNNIFAGYEDSKAVIRNIYEDGDSLITGHTDSVSAVVYSPKGNLMATASYDKSIIVWDTASLAMIQKITNLPEQLSDHGKITAIAFSPAGNKIAYGDEMGNVVIWDLQDDSIQSSTDYDEHKGFILSISFGPDGTQLISGGSDSTLRTWKIDKFITLENVYQSQGGWLNDVSYLPDGDRVLAASSNASIILLDLTTGQIIKNLDGHRNEVESIAINKTGEFALSGGRDGLLIKWDLEVLHPINSIQNKPDTPAEIIAMKKIPNSDQLIISTSNGNIQIWDLATKELVADLQASTDGAAVWGLAVNPNGKEFLTGSYNGQLTLWDVNSKLPIRNFKNQIVGIRSVDLSADGKLAVTGYANGDVAVWDLETGESVCNLEGHTNIVNDARFTPDGVYVISGSNDHTVLLWEIKNCDAEVSPVLLYSHQSWVMAIDISPDGRLVASGSSDHSIIIWDLATERQLHRLQLPDTGSIPGIDGFVLSVSFSPDGRLIAASYANGSVALWSVADEILLRRFISPLDTSCIYRTRCFWVWDVTFSQNSDELFTGSADGTLRTWPIIRTEDLTALRLWVKENRFLRSLTEEEKGAYGIDD